MLSSDTGSTLPISTSDASNSSPSIYGTPSRISFVLSDAIPFYNYATGRYGMELYARILGLYGADTVGYIIMRLYEEGGFVSFFDLTAVYAG